MEKYYEGQPDWWYEPPREHLEACVCDDCDEFHALDRAFYRNDCLRCQEELWLKR